MQTTRPRLAALFACVAAAALSPASGAGFASGGGSAVLGQPLDFAVQLRTEVGENLSSECVSADVVIGERTLPATLVRAVVDTLGPETARVRVLTTVAVEEPVVGVTIRAGCAARIERRFVVLADPPALGPAAADLRSVDVLTGAADRARAPGSDEAAQSPRPRTDRRTPAPPSRVQAASVRRNDEQQQVPPPQEPAARAPQSRRAAARSSTATATATAAAAPTPRLRLDIAEPTGGRDAVIVEQAIAAVAEAASAARSAASAALAADLRIASLERNMAQLRSDAQAQRDEASALRQRLARTDTTSRWLMPLLAAVVALAALTAWLAWRLAAAQRLRQAPWRSAAAEAAAVETARAAALAAPPSTAVIPFLTSEIGKTPVRGWPGGAAQPERNLPSVAPDTTRDAKPTDDAVSPETAPEPEVQRTQPLASGTGPGDDGAARDVSIEELIDLEQQAEFFVVLGQDEAAIDLLVEHLRLTGGGSPLPYLKLLEIHRRRGERQPYERFRVRFNHRFNAYAPEWDEDLLQGRSLEDYPGVVPRLQQVWPRPLDAMAELEALLFRKSRGELFELPAYRDVLFLYSMARDLLDREPGDTASVDLLLPLADRGDFGTTPPQPSFGVDPRADDDPRFMADGDDRPTAPVDLDLTQSDRGSGSIFDVLRDPKRP